MPVDPLDDQRALIFPEYNIYSTQLPLLLVVAVILPFLFNLEIKALASTSFNVTKCCNGKRRRVKISVLGMNWKVFKRAHTNMSHLSLSFTYNFTYNNGTKKQSLALTLKCHLIQKECILFLFSNGKLRNLPKPTI